MFLSKKDSLKEKSFIHKNRYVNKIYVYVYFLCWKGVKNDFLKRKDVVGWDR